jgi:DNA-3-methyladenine glycosylase I
MNRCPWCEINDIERKYHDTEWGVPSYDDRHLFEMLILEGAQAGLSWDTILKRREGYCRAFEQFDIKKVAGYDEKKKAQLMQNTEIIRNRLKIESAVNNAQAFMQIQKESGSFSNYLWKFVNNTPIINHPKLMNEIPVSTHLSDIISKDLKKRGFKFVGTTILYAYLQAVGVVDDHLVSCHKKINNKNI